MTDRLNLCNQTLKLPSLNKSIRRKHHRENRLSRGTSKHPAPKDSDSEVGKRCLSNCNIKNCKPKGNRQRYNIQLSEKFLNMLNRKICKKNRKRKVFSEEREFQNRSIVDKVNLFKNVEYEQFVEKIERKVNLAKNIKMYELQSNFKLIHKITRGGIDRFISNDFDSNVVKVFSSKSINSNQLSKNEDSIEEKHHSKESNCNISEPFEMISIKRNCLSPANKRKFQTIQALL